MNTAKIKIVGFLILVFVPSFLIAQKTYDPFRHETKKVSFYDIDNTPISKKEFRRKALSEVYFYLEFEIDNHILYKLQWRYFYAKLNKTDKRQLFQLLSSKNDVDTTKTIVIHYTDTLKNKSEYPKESLTIFNKDSSKHKHLVSYEAFLDGYKKCYDKFDSRKAYANIYHFYNVNNGHPNQLGKYVWKKDNHNVLKALFIKNLKNPGIIIINTKGEYFVHYRYDFTPEPRLHDKLMRDEKNWKRPFKRFLKTVNKLNKG